MKPRIFISSTYYDLKYVRESLEKFLYNMNFEPVLFEANKVTFEHGKPLDVSCFNEVKTCHIMILMIGGRYGSIISEQDSEIEKLIYDKEYTSITRKEYETALQNNIPTFIFIDKNVHSEYNTYKINREFYDTAVKDFSFKFFSVDSINVFKFIDLVSNKALKSFEKIEEIEFYLRDQISGMFHLYLESLKQNSKQDEIFDAVKELKNLTSSMNAVVKEVGKKIIDPDRYKEIIDEQFSLLVSFLFDKFYDYVDYTGENSIFEIDDETIDKLVNYFLTKILTEKSLEEITFHSKMTLADYTLKRDTYVMMLNGELNQILKGFSVNYSISSLIRTYNYKIKSLITSDEHMKTFLKELRKAIQYADMPF